jgi:hypothetical protein
MQIHYTDMERDALKRALEHFEHVIATDPRANGMVAMFRIVMMREPFGDTNTPGARRDTLASRMPALRARMAKELNRVQA